MRLYIIRHADPDYPNNTITAAGHLEARALADRLTKEGIDKIYSSPLGRARDTARYTAERLGLGVEVQKWLSELNLLHKSEHVRMAWDIHGHILRDGRADGVALHPELDRDGFREEIERVRRDSDGFMAGLGFVRKDGVYEVGRPAHRRVAVFCHGGLGLTWLSHLLAIRLESMWAAFWMPPSSVSLVLMDERIPGVATPRCLCLGDTSHLHAAGLPVLPAGIKANFD